MPNTPRPPRRVTIPDVARHAGVGQATAARVLGGYGSASAATRERVLAAAAELGYSTNAVARSMISGRTHTLGVVVADVENPYFARAVRGVTDVAAKAGLQVVLANSDENGETEKSAVQMFIERRVDGLVVAPAAAEHGHLDKAVASGVPVVLLDRVLAGAELDTVVVDNRGAAKAAVARFTGAGHRRIAVVTSASGDEDSVRLAPGADIWTTTERLTGYRQALRAAGIPREAELIRHTGYDRTWARSAVLDLMSSDDRPTALFTTDNVATLGTLDALLDLGARIPDDVSVIGFDDAEWTTLVRPRLSVVGQPVQELGGLAADILVRRINGSTARPRRHTLRTTYIARESTGPAPARLRRLGVPGE
ncbi:LacI family DNA-binding transcriptional regulator [Streptomyces flaveolus]|uniref:LacI family DNA-binding transcriptional regulator n=1 Tax=Streptomyces flaveolus TaxID=67297 RepID=UPI00167015F8|nr:LacI family DNA-binding transcriptional regulator [Streptomyces flaveolus]GGQ86074.1 LacI family transcriptional regulator [Streptomyces flaveolus]